MKHFTTYFLVCLLFALMSGGSAKAQTWDYYITDGTAISSNTGLTSGYYLLSVWGIYDEGLLYWAGDNSDGSQFAIKPTTYSSKLNKLIDISDRTGEDAKYVWYLEVQEGGSKFTMKSVAEGSKYPSMNGVAATATGNFVAMKSVENSTDADAAVFTIDATDTSKDDSPITIPSSSGKPHFIVQISNATYSGGEPTYIHVKGDQSQGAVASDWHLEYFSGFNRNIPIVSSGQKVSCAKFAFFKLSEAAAFTYDYKINGATVKTEEKTLAVGSDYPALATMPDYCTATAPEGTVSREDHGNSKEITVTWSGPLAFSSTVDNAHWYHMKFGNQQRFVVNTGANTAIPLAEASAQHTTASTEQWAFVGNPFDGFQVYNRRKLDDAFGRLASSSDLSANQGRNSEVTVHYGILADGKTDCFDILNKSKATNTISYTDAFMLCTHGNATNKMNWASDGTTQRIAYWTAGSGPNSAFTVQEPTLPALNLTAIGENTYGTYYIDYPIAVPENVSVYIGNADLTNGRISMTKATDHVIPAETGVVLVGDDNSATSCTMTTNCGAGTLEKGSLTGSLEATDIAGYNDQYLVFGRSTDANRTLGFYKPADSITRIPANKAFIEIPNTSSVQGLALNFCGDTETGITLATLLAPETQSAGTVYDLSGRRVSTPAKGCYIRNGKKVFIK